MPCACDVGSKMLKGARRKAKKADDFERITGGMI